MKPRQSRTKSLFVFGTALFALVSACTKAQTSHSNPPQPGLQKVVAKDVTKLASAPGANINVVNVWATWCEPCQEEMPELAKFQKAYASKGVRMILVSADDASDESKAHEFLKKVGVDFPSYILGESPGSFVKGFKPDWVGGLPATFIVDPRGKVLTYWVGKSTFGELEAKVKPHLAIRGERR